jgi:hypothetical protein
VELSILSAVTQLPSCVEFQFNNIGPFIIRSVIFMHLRAHVMPQPVTRTLSRHAEVTAYRLVARVGGATST